jgi:hypothetical protein
MLPSRGIGQERAWLRRTMTRQYDALASNIGRLLAENPGLRGDAGTAQSDAQTDLVALHMYLSGRARQVDAAVRSGQVGPHVPFGRCVAAGLLRMPSYRGATRLSATLKESEWAWYRDRRLVTEWAFCSALASGSAGLPGDVEFLIWSRTGRRTHLIEPRVPSQVLFPPGTNFKLLRVRGDERREILLREISPGEISADGSVEPGEVPHDEIALRGLERASGAWRQSGAEVAEDLLEGYRHRFGNPPGLIIEVGAKVPADSSGARQMSAH